MVTVARVFDSQLGSAAPVFQAFLAVHVLAGLTAVVSGAAAALVRKGSPQHIRAGRWYYLAITVDFATVLAALRRRQDYYLFIIGTVAFTAATIGYQHRRRSPSLMSLRGRQFEPEDGRWPPSADATPQNGALCAAKPRNTYSISRHS